MKDIAFGIFGLITLLAIAFLFSDNKKKIRWQQAGLGIGLQIIIAVFVILTPWGAQVFDYIGQFFVKIISFTTEGSKFVFGALAEQGVFGKAFPEDMQSKGVGFLFAFQVLPTLIFFASLMSVLYHLGLMQKVVQGMAWVMAKILKISGSESISVVANV
ncbi:MAG: NupC/NupG family nucleoside CNT transporter, partial [Calditrichales bacterium]|nr:NupC/NupG family nucleoside CNT transporter [Calditrichales bacterium]